MWKGREQTRKTLDSLDETERFGDGQVQRTREKKVGKIRHKERGRHGKSQLAWRFQAVYETRLYANISKLLRG